MTPEGKVKAKVKKILAALGCYYFSPQSGIYGRSGIPDIIGCHNGKFFAIECKAGDNKPTALQEREIGTIMGCGGLALVVNETNVNRLQATLILLGS